MTDTNNADDLILLTNTTSKLNSLKEAAGGIVPYVNANKTEHMFLYKELSPLLETSN